jgi:hypothetical protein
LPFWLLFARLRAFEGKRYVYSYHLESHVRGFNFHHIESVEVHVLCLLFVFNFSLCFCVLVELY